MNTFTHLERLGRLAWIVFAAVFLALLVIVGLGLPTNHDEYQYLAAAWLYRDLAIYGEYFYSQTPYYPAFYSLIFRIFVPEGTGIFALGRIMTVVWSVLFFFSLAYVLRLTTPGRFLQIGILSCVFTSQFMGLPLSTARNDIMPIALTSCALLAIVLAGRREGPAWLDHCAAGVFLSLALWTKQSFAFIIPALGPYLVYIWWKNGGRQTLHAAAALALGGLVASIPAVIIIARSPANFFYSVATFHRTQHVLWPRPSRPLYMMENLTKVVDKVLEPAFGMLALIGAIFLLWLVFRGRNVKFPLDDGSLKIAVFCFGAAACIGASFLLAKPFHIQYASPVLPFAAVFAGSCAKMVVQRAADDRRMAMIGLCNVIGMIALAFSIYSSVPQWTKSVVARALALADRMETADPEQSQIFAFEQARTARILINGAIRSQDPDLKVATILSPFPIEAGFAIYPEFAGAPFFYRSNDYMSEDRLEELVGTSPARVVAMLSASNAKAVLVGYDRNGGSTSEHGHSWNNWPKLETGLVDYAKARDFQCFETPLQKAYRTQVLRLYVSPDIAAGPGNCRD